MPRGGRLHGLAHNLGGRGNRYPVEILTKGTDQDWLPKSLNRAWCLPMLLQPLVERFSGIFLHGHSKRNHGPGNRQFVRRGQEWKTQEGRRGVKRRRQRRRTHHGGAASGFNKRHLVVPADLVAPPDALKNLDRVGAAEKGQVWGVAAPPAGAGMLIQRGAPPGVRTTFKSWAGEAETPRGAGGGPPRQPASSH